VPLFRLKKWYFDVITEQGDVLYAYLIIYRLAGVGRAILSAHLAASNGRHVRDSLTVSAPSVKTEDRIDLGAHIFEKTADGCHIVLNLPRLAVDLRYASEGAWRPNPKGVLLKKGRRSLAWEVPLFRASVSGTLNRGPEKINACGTGYHDLVWTDIPPWRLPISELLWGRAHFPSATLVFNQLTTRENGVLQNILVKTGHSLLGAHGAGGDGRSSSRPRWIEDRRFQVRESDGNGNATLSHPAFSVSLKERRVLEESPVSTPDRIGWAAFRKALDRLSGRPTERKILSEALLDVGGGMERGLAIHERVLWIWSSRSKEARS